MTKVWESSEAEGGELLLLLAIADFADDQGTAHAYIDELSRKCRQSPRATTYQIGKLQEKGEVKISHKRGRGRPNQFQINMQKLHALAGESMQNLHAFEPENMQNLHVFENEKHAKSCTYHVPSLKKNKKHSPPFSPSSEIRGADAPEKKSGGEGKSTRFELPTLPEFTDRYLDAKMLAWIERYCPGIGPQLTTLNFLEYHQSENTEFTTEPQFLKAWRGWMRNARKLALDRAEKRAEQEATNGAGRNADRSQSRSIRNLRATAEAYGIPEPEITGAPAVRAYAAKLANRKRAAGGGSG